MKSKINSGWTYISLNYDADTRPWFVLNKLMADYRVWLEEHLGSQGDTWEYGFGDRYASGIYFKEAQAATAFKLSFNI